MAGAVDPNPGFPGDPMGRLKCWNGVNQRGSLSPLRSNNDRLFEKYVSIRNETNRERPSRCHLFWVVLRLHAELYWSSLELKERWLHDVVPAC